MINVLIKLHALLVAKVEKFIADKRSENIELEDQIQGNLAEIEQAKKLVK